MDKEIDVKLFVTCRLCIEEVGQYQIVPNIQEQFKYCFDINVDPFDGLPQLICQKCKDILNQFAKLKKAYCEKQSDLTSKYKQGIPIECTPQHDIVTSSSTLTSSSQNVPLKKINRSELSTESNDSVRHKKKKKVKIVVNQPKEWDHTGFKKEFVCIVCNRGWSSIESLRKHRTAHTKILAQHPAVFEKKMSIVLEKIDGKPNFTGMNNIVAHNSNVMIEHYNSLCYIKYLKEKSGTDDEKQSKNVNAISSIASDNFDSEEEIIRRTKHRKRRRLSSGSSSSTDTLVVESNKGLSDDDDNDNRPSIERSDVPHSQVTDDQCISIGDSSDSDTDKHRINTTYKAKQSSETNEDDRKVIEGIIEACVKAYNKKTEKSNSNIESQLKHKILSLGRRIINNRFTFNSTGLLKYLAHKDLSIVWVKKAISFNSGKDSDYIRILTKLRGVEESGDNQGWRPVATPINEISVAEPERASVSNQVKNSISNIAKNVDDSAVLFICNQIENKSKLLNANPVANPKQLPRKSTQSNECRLNTPTIESNSPFHNNEDTNLCLPIITSTTSLATPKVVETNQNDDPGLTPAPEKQSEMPRIKVKPFSQLMSEKALNNFKNDAPINILQNRTENPINILQNMIANVSSMPMNPIQNSNMLWVSQDLSNTIMPNIIISSQTPVSQPIQMGAFIPQTYTSINSKADASSRKEEYCIMNCVDLPNTKTSSPIDYLKNLYLLHNLFLIEPPPELSRRFICLIKFKVKFQQECVADPLILCLSLYCYKNNFCFTVRDRNDVQLNIAELSANWQWEIINVFRGDLVTKLLNNALKHSQETFDYTNQFICLLKSVTFKKTL